MAKKNTDTVYEVLKGFDIPSGRFEIDETVKDSQLTKEEKAALIEMEAIGIASAFVETEDGKIRKVIVEMQDTEVKDGNS